MPPLILVATRFTLTCALCFALTKGVAVLVLFGKKSITLGSCGLPLLLAAFLLALFWRDCPMPCPPKS